MEVRGQKIGIVDAVEYLGRKHSFKDLHETELDHRISKTWDKFMMMKGELCSKHYRLQDRLRLFQATVSATVLYGSGSWTLTARLEEQLRTTQRRMLRWMMGGGRRHVTSGINENIGDSGSDATSEEEPEEGKAQEAFEEELESWVEWIQRTTHVAEKALHKAGTDDWVKAQKRNKN